MAISLTSYEKEAVILTSKVDDEFSFNPGCKRRLAAFSEEYLLINYICIRGHTTAGKVYMNLS